jgi:hypothetical protein
MNNRLTFLTSQSRTVHRLAHRPQHQPNGVFHLDVVFVLLLQQTLSRAVVCSYTRRLPARVIPRWVGVVQLEVVVRVVAGVEEGDAKGAET